MWSHVTWSSKTTFENQCSKCCPGKKKQLRFARRFALGKHPIILPQNSGGVEIVEGSHKWGHIPHQNREPTNLPKNIKEKKIEVDLGSALIMTSFTLHRTVKSKVSTSYYIISCIR